jgi:hypothetical protein
MRPKIAIISDVRNWAWARKAEQLRQHLGDQFQIEVAHLYDAKPDPLPQGRDLYNTFEVFQARQLPAGLPYVTGMTAHVWRTWEQQHGPGTVRKWAAGALAFHANSKLLEAEMHALLERPICYVPNGVDELFFSRRRRRRSSTWWWAGSASPTRARVPTSWPKPADAPASSCAPSSARTATR